MQTFLPYPDFNKSIKTLDARRLGKQRVEGLQLLDCLRLRQDWEPLPTKAFRNHTAVKMWQGHEQKLFNYVMLCCQEWLLNDFEDTVSQKIVRLLPNLPKDTDTLPWWFGNENFHKSHRISLLWKNFEHYKHHFTDAEEQETAKLYIRTGLTYRTWWPTEHLSEKS